MVLHYRYKNSSETGEDLRQCANAAWESFMQSVSPLSTFSNTSNHIPSHTWKVWGGYIPTLAYATFPG